MKMVIVPIVFSLLFLIGVWFAIYNCPVSLPDQYSTLIPVETPDKIENAVSNAVSDLVKRDFVPVCLEVDWHPASKTYVIHIGGIDRTNLGKYEP